MIKLIALTQYLKERRLVPPEQLDSWTDQVTLDLFWKPDVDGLHMGDMRYSATIDFERFADHPGRRGCWRAYRSWRVSRMVQAVWKALGVALSTRSGTASVLAFAVDWFCFFGLRLFVAGLLRFRGLPGR